MSQHQVELFAYDARTHESAEEAAENQDLVTLGVFPNAAEPEITTATFAATQMAWSLGYSISEIGIALKHQDGTYTEDVHII